MSAIYRRVYAEAYGNWSLTGYPEWRDLWNPLEIIFYQSNQSGQRVVNAQIYRDIERYWDEFLRAYFLTTGESGYVTRERFHDDTGIPPGEMDWELWRALKRGTP